MRFIAAIVTATNAKKGSCQLMNRSIIDTNKLLSLFKEVLSWWSKKQGFTTRFSSKLRVTVIDINIIYLIHFFSTKGVYILLKELGGKIVPNPV